MKVSFSLLNPKLPSLRRRSSFLLRGWLRVSIGSPMGCCGDDADAASGEGSHGDGFNWHKFSSLVNFASPLVLLTLRAQSFWFLIHGTVLTSLLIEETEIYDDLTTNDRGHIVAILYFALMVVCGYSAFEKRAIV